MPYSTRKRPFHLTTPLGEDVLLLQRFDGSEALSEPFEFQLTMASEDDAVDPARLVGKRLTLWADRGDEDSDDGACWSGIVASFGRSGSRWFAGAGEAQELTLYEAVLVPWFWQLKLVEDCRIFQQQSIPDIVDAILGELQLGQHEFRLSGKYPPIEYCVQYNESSFDFIARLLEDAGIHYYFRHDPHEPADKLVISDHQEKDYKGQVANLRYAANWAEQYEPVVFELARRQGMRTGHLAMRDFDFTRPAQDMDAGVDTLLTVGANKSLQRFGYPGGYLDRDGGDTRAKLAMEIEEAGHERLDGSATFLQIRPGMAFRLDDAPNAVLEPAWRTLRARHRGENNLADDNGESYYRNDFTVMPLERPWRPLRRTPRPRIRGPQTAIVTGPGGEEIYTDQYGRVKLHFFWDRHGSADDKSSCWVRVSQAWAGNGWGAFFLPRIGMEVIVDFIDGDPDHPLVCGCVYNGANATPYALPGEMTKSTLKTMSSKGGGGFNELRFEDKKGSEEIFLHAARDLQARVEHDSVEAVGGDRDISIAGNRKETVKGDQHHEVKGARVSAVDKDDGLSVKGNLSISANQDIGIDAGGSAMHQAGMEFHVKAGTNLVLEAGVSISLKAGASSVVLGPAGVTIDGMLVQVNCGGSPLSANPPQKPDLVQSAKDAIVVAVGSALSALQQAQAAALHAAAAIGAPFCAECAAAKAALEAMGHGM